MTVFLILIIVLCIVIIALLWSRNRDLQRDYDEAFDNWGFWVKQCKAERTEAMSQLDDSRFANQKLREHNGAISDQLKSTESQLSGVRKHLADELENNCRLVHRLNATEARLADAELRIAAASENLANTPPQPLEQD